MKERPIIFNGAMVYAILSGQKTQTRRPVKPQPASRDGILPIDAFAFMPHKEYPDLWVIQSKKMGVEQYRKSCPGADADAVEYWRARCPFGDVGDRLWVRETHHVPGGYLSKNDVQEISEGISTPETFGVLYRADMPKMYPCDGGWAPSIHMPRWASRITLEIVGIRVERVQNISGVDAMAEGLKTISKDGGKTYKHGIPDQDGWPGSDDNGWEWQEWETDPVKFYYKLWDSIYADKHPWKDNPWVWVIEFKRVMP